MAIEKSTHTPKLSLNLQHDYITLRTPNGNFTAGYSRFKASGGIDRVSFEKLMKFVDPKGDLSGCVDNMRKLLDPKVLSKYFPDWDNAPVTPALVKVKKGQTAEIDLTKIKEAKNLKDVKTRYAVRGKVKGSVLKVTKKYVTLQVTKAGKTTNVQVPRVWIKG